MVVFFTNGSVPNTAVRFCLCVTSSMGCAAPKALATHMAKFLSPLRGFVAPLSGADSTVAFRGLRTLRVLAHGYEKSRPAGGNAAARPIGSRRRDAARHFRGRRRDAGRHTPGGRRRDAPRHFLGRRRDAPRHTPGRRRDAGRHTPGRRRDAGRHTLGRRRDAGRHTLGRRRDAGRHVCDYGLRYTSLPRATTSASSMRTHHNAAALFPQLFETAISFVVAL